MSAGAWLRARGVGMACVTWLAAVPGTRCVPRPVLAELQPSGPWELRDRVTVFDGRHARLWDVPSEFVTDKASIPRGLWNVVSRDDLGDAGAIAHDWLYRHGGAAFGRETFTYTRAEADRLFLDLMLADGVTRWRAALAYLAVRTFGSTSWLPGVRRALAPAAAPVSGEGA